MTYYPNRENYVVLECGCITIPWTAIHLLGEKDDNGTVYRLPCPRGIHYPKGDSKAESLGFIIRVAEPADIERFLADRESTLF